MITVRVTKTKEEKLQQMHELKREGFMSSHKISKMLNSGLQFNGDRDELFTNMRNLVGDSRDIEAIKLECRDDSNIVYWYKSWDIAKILKRLENRTRIMRAS